jgi:type I restriction enzyme, S subunit
MELLTKKLGDICHLITDGKHGNCKDQLDSGYYFVSCKDVKGGQVNYSGARQISAEDFKETDRRTQFAAGDILITNSGTIGRMCLAKDLPETRRTTFQKSVAIIKADNDLVTSEYLYYYLLSEKDRLCNFAGGAAQKNLLLSDMRCFDVEIPKDKLLQKNWASKVRSYDLLIENNNRRIAILEDMAQSLYREWFVNFRYPNHEDNLDADGKPKLIDSPLGQIPEGWEVKSAAEAITINPKTKLVKEGEKPFVGMSGLSQDSMVIGDIIEKTGNSGAKFINGDTLFARITPCLQNGKTGYVQFLTPEQPVGFGSTEFIVLRESEYLSSEYIYLLSRSNNFREHAIQSMTGATGRQRVHNDCFASCYLPVPPKELMNEFTQLVKPMFKNIFNLSKRNENLKQQRDMLLPKLISGQIELKD